MPGFFLPMKNVLILILAALPSFAMTSKPDPKTTLDQLIDYWHIAAGEANFDAYFGPTAENFVFLGTAPEERWTKEEFMIFSKPYFDRGKAWDFKPSNRIWEFSKNGKMAWFDEDLDTWMRGCRGSGICQKIKGEWKLVYYNLHVLIENEKMDAFIQLRDQLPPSEGE